MDNPQNQTTAPAADDTTVVPPTAESPVAAPEGTLPENPAEAPVAPEVPVVEASKQPVAQTPTQGETVAAEEKPAV